MSLPPCGASFSHSIPFPEYPSLQAQLKLPGVFVHVAAGEQRPGIRVTSGAGGGFELLGVSEEMGEVALFTGLASYNWGNPNQRLGAGPPVSARAGDSDVLLTLRDLVLLTGRVEDPAGQPVSGVTVEAYSSGTARLPEARLAKAVTDADGAFQLDLPEGSQVDLETVPPEQEDGSEEATPAPSVPVRLEFVESDARDVVLRLVE